MKILLSLTLQSFTSPRTHPLSSLSRRPRPVSRNPTAYGLDNALWRLAALAAAIFSGSARYRTLVFPHAGPRPEAFGTRFAAIRQAMAARLDDPRRPAGEHHEHSGRPQSALQGETMFCEFLSGKGAHHQHQRGSAEGAAWPCSRLLPALPARGRSPWNNKHGVVKQHSVLILRSANLGHSPARVLATTDS